MDSLFPYSLKTRTEMHVLDATLFYCLYFSSFLFSVKVNFSLLQLSACLWVDKKFSSTTWAKYQENDIHDDDNDED